MESLSDICSRLWDLDRNRLKRGEKMDYQIKLKRKAKAKGGRDKLFTFVKREKLEGIPTYSAFMELLDHYEAETSKPEEETERQYDLSRAFLSRCLDTDVMKEAHTFLLRKGLVPRSYRKAFKEKLYDLWFKLHPRPSGDGTERSAFEHIFVGETCNRQVLGFHNWVRLYEEERQGNVIYKRYRPQACDDHIITIDFSWNGKKKSFGSFFLGTSPEFELAIYTVCFLAGDGDSTKVTLGKKEATIVVNDENGQIGTCYPKIDEGPVLVLRWRVASIEPGSVIVFHVFHEELKTVTNKNMNIKKILNKEVVIPLRVGAEAVIALSPDHCYRA
ncbi:poly(U)-specific endoribonuclease-like [Branchiostoma floridae x Branchiostoma belcheri]